MVKNHLTAIVTKTAEQVKGRIDVFIVAQLQKVHLWVTANKSMCLLVALIGLIYFALQMMRYTKFACMQIKEENDWEEGEEIKEMSIEEQQQFKKYSQKKIKQAIIVGLVSCIFNVFVSKMLDFH